MLVTLGRYLDSNEGQILRMRLEAEGIPAFVFYQHHSTLDWPLTNALGGTRLMVPASRLDDARAVLADYANGALESDLLAEVGANLPGCLQCGGSTQKRITIPWSQRVLVFFLWMWGAVFPTREATVCATCGTPWRAH